jgi:hypothetical protein
MNGMSRRATLRLVSSAISIVPAACRIARQYSTRISLILLSNN